MIDLNEYNKIINEAKNSTNLDEIEEAVLKESKNFIDLYGPERLSRLDGMELVKTMFLHDKQPNLIYYLEHNKSEQMYFGHTQAISAMLYGIYKTKDEGKWIYSVNNKEKHFFDENNPDDVSKLVNIAKQIRDLYVRGERIIADNLYCEQVDDDTFNIIRDKLIETEKEIGCEYRLYSKVFFLKYVFLCNPNLLFPLYTYKTLSKLLKVFNISDADRDNDLYFIPELKAQFYLNCFVQSNYGIKTSVFYYLTYDKTNELVKNGEKDMDVENIYENGINLIVYGTPGCGKSYFVDHKFINPDFKENVIRTTFYLDYSYSDFIGQLVPITSEDHKEVTYDFKPGPFVLALQKAYEDLSSPVYLVIEELNRGNAPAIFGDIFQLLDRFTSGDKNDTNYRKGFSKYPITNNNITNYLKRELGDLFDEDTVVIPSNLYVVGTMNTSDQNVFTLDTAFKRRWILKKIQNHFEDKDISKLYVPKTDITWGNFATCINEKIRETKNALLEEDKELGVYFVSSDLLDSTKNHIEVIRNGKIELSNAEKFAYKVFEYLWNDVHKITNNIFDEKFETLDSVIAYYLNNSEVDFSELFNNIDFKK